MKKQPRVIAFDDGKFTFRQGRVPLVGVIVRLPSYVEGAMVTDCEIDGTDATQQVVDSILRSRLREQLRLVMLDGIACGGFNIYDLERVNADTGVPVVSVTRSAPSLDEMGDALRKHFKDWRERLQLVTKYMPRQVTGSGFTLYSKAVGLEEEDELELLESSIVRGNYPEPLRLAHIFAGAVSAGESRGKA